MGQEIMYARGFITLGAGAHVCLVPSAYMLETCRSLGMGQAGGAERHRE